MVDAPQSFRFRTLAVLAISAAGMAFAAPAQAATSGSAMIASAVVNVAMATDCRNIGPAAFTTSQVVGEAALLSRPRSKPLSALERMRLEQSGALAPAKSVSIAPYNTSTIASGEASAGPAGAVLAPAAFGGIQCAQRFDPVRSGRAASRFDFLESRILPVTTTSFDTAWNRVSARAGGGAVRRAMKAADAGEGAMVDRIAGVNRWVNRKVAYTADKTLYGKADYWASAGETLSRGKGDCEDYAIAKMEVLAAMGVAREDMYLTIARDLARRDDHAVLIVKLDGRAILLDNATDELLDGERANDYRPILSFNANRRYLHGY